MTGVVVASTVGGGGAVRPLSPWLRGVLLVTAIMAAVAGAQLFLGTEHTERYFAWTIASHLTAASLGACYWAGALLLLLAWRRPDWASARVAAVGAQVLLALLVAAVLLHADVLHTGSSDAVTFVATWAFLLAYLALTPAVLVALLHQTRVRGNDPSRRRPLGRWLRAGLTGAAALLLTVGTVLFVGGADADVLWPWALTSIAARVFGAFGIALGVVLALAAWQDDSDRARPVLTALLALSALEAVALARYGGQADWGVAGWLFAASLVYLAALGAVGLARRA